MTKKMIPRLLIVLVLFMLIIVYVGWHVMKFLFQWLPPELLPLYWVITFLSGLGYLLGFALRAKAVAPIGRFLEIVGSFFFAILPYLFMQLIVVDFIWVLLKFLKIQTTHFTTICGIIVSLISLISLAFGVRNAVSAYVRNHSIQINKSAKNLSALNIVAISDIHLGHMIGNRRLRKMVTQINALKPDVILFVGDVLDHSVEPFIRNNMSANFAKLQSQFGAYAILGNHEYYSGDIDTYVAKMAEVGVPVLQDEIAEIADAIYIVGRKDLAARSHTKQPRQEVAELTSKLDQTRPIILLDHQPLAFDKSAAAGADILFCGHTHRGQIYPFHLVTQKVHELDWGYKLKEQMHIIVSSGYGTWGPPMRIGSRSEIIHVKVEFIG